MRDKNVLSVPVYLIAGLFYMAGAAFAYDELLYARVGELSSGASRGIWYGLMVGVFAVCFALTVRKRRNFLSLAVNTLLPFEIYTAIAYWDILWVPLLIFGGVVLLLWGAYWVYLFLMKKLKRFRPETRRGKWIWWAQGTRTIFAAAFLSLLIPLLIVMIIGSFQSSAQSPPADTDGSYTIEGNRDTLRNFLPERWETLAKEEKLRTLQTVCDIETHALGLPHALHVEEKELEEDTIAQYEDVSHNVYVNRSYLDGRPRKLLDAMLHESYHAYQFSLVELYRASPPEYRNLAGIREAEQYRKEFENYEGGGDFDVYSSQLCEQKAEEYAAEAICKYDQIITYYGNPAFSGTESAEGSD